MIVQGKSQKQSVKKLDSLPDLQINGKHNISVFSPPEANCAGLLVDLTDDESCHRVRFDSGPKKSTAACVSGNFFSNSTSSMVMVNRCNYY